MIYFFLCYYRQFTWWHHWRSSWIPFSCVSIGTSLGDNLRCLPGFLFCVWTLGASVWCFCCILGYPCVTGEFIWFGSTDTSCLSYRRTIYLLHDCFFAAFGMILNNSDRILNTVWCVSFIFANSVFGVGSCNDSNKSFAANVAVSEHETLGIITFWGGKSTKSAVLSDIVSFTNTL